MGGSGSGGAFMYRTPKELHDLVRKQEDKTRSEVFGGELAGALGDLLGAYNSRDIEGVQNRLEELRNHLGEFFEGTFDHIYGGSVAKHTYVDGMSDIDSLFFVNESELEGLKPGKILKRIEDILRKAIGTQATITRGRMAVTLDYGDGMVLQLLPALRAGENEFNVPSARKEDEWSSIDPRRFQESLTKRNKECGGKLIPTIKLAKAILGQLPASQKLSGYHLEALAIEAFGNYNKTMTTSAMLPEFFQRAADLILIPIRDGTGQSINVDEYLGSENSSERRTFSHLLRRIARRMQNASAAESITQWNALFGI